MNWSRVCVKNRQNKTVGANLYYTQWQCLMLHIRPYIELSLKL